ncbi:MAG: HTH domain-containing protein [Methanobacteriota archaeon]
MKVVSCTRRGTSVRKSLNRVANEINEILSKTLGRITKLDATIESGISGANVRVIVAVDESDLRPKRIVWANEAGSSEEAALNLAQGKINEQMEKIRGEIAGLYVKLIAPPLLKRTYATIIVAVNENLPKKIEQLDMYKRRERLASVLNLLANDSKSINIAQVAKILGVSRDTIYKDLQYLDIKRVRGSKTQ